MPSFDFPARPLFMKVKRIDTRAIGLEVGSALATWLTGTANLHYGLWDGLEANASNLGAAQTAYTDRLLGFLPDGKLSILDIGGGAGVTAKRLIALGHQVRIIVPSSYLAVQCRESAPDAEVYETTFEDFETEERFDLCLFSESFQYIPLETALNKALKFTKRDGQVLIADCFRSESYFAKDGLRPPGGGHSVAKFRAAIAELPLKELVSEDITVSVAPSIDIEQALYNVLGTAVSRIDAELANKKPVARRIILLILRLILRKRGLERIDARIRGDFRTSEAFIENNEYLITLLQKQA